MTNKVVKHIMEKIWKRDFSQIPEVIQKYLWWIVVICLIIATYQAWLDEHLKLENSNIILAKVQAENKEKDNRIQDLKAQVANIINKKEDKPEHFEMIGFYDENILIPTNKAVGLNQTTIKLMEASPHFNYSAIIQVQGNSIAYLETGNTPTKDTGLMLYPGDRLTEKSITNMKQFKAIAIGGNATLAVSYYRGK